MKKWTVGKPDINTVKKLMTGCGVTGLAACVLAQRGYTSPEQVAERLNVSELSDPFLLRDMQNAADAVNSAIDSGESICVYGDYDCDGIMSTVILYSYLKEIGAQVSYYIPERSEGYGLNRAAIKRIADGGAHMIITVDNGIAAIDEAEYIYELGMRLVVTDHHQQGEELPRAEAVVDAHRLDDTSPFKFMCGAGIALKLVAALDGGDCTLALEQFGDLAAIATVADIVSLTGENRFLVSYGLELVSNTDRPGLIALKSVSGLEGKEIDSERVAFGIAPRINAAGRMGSPRRAAELMLCEDPEEALAIAQEIDALNSKRKSEEERIHSEIYAMLDAAPSLLTRRVVFLCGRDWHHGIIGIVASHIEEQFGKPCFLASESGGEIRGSARAFGEFSVFHALSAAAEALEKFGGHKGAGGFTIKSGMTERFRELLEKYALENHSTMPVLTLSAAAQVSPAALTPDNVKGLSALQPFGEESEKPLFFIGGAFITDIIPLSNGLHSKLRLKYGGRAVEALYFRNPPSSLSVKNGDACDIIASLEINEYNGLTSVNLFIKDIRAGGFAQNRFFAASSAFESFVRGEELPQNYYPVMLPVRDDVVKLYTNIAADGISSDRLYLRIADERYNYCRFRTALEALRQLGLVTVSAADSTVKRVNVTQKADLDSAPILLELRKKIKA